MKSIEMRRSLPRALALATLALFLLQACSSKSTYSTSPPYGSSYGRATPPAAKAWEASLGRPSAVPISSGALLRQVNVQQRFIPDGRYGRRYDRPMTPRYITIHSTQNYSGDAWDHALALQRGKLRGGTYGYMCWHYTVQQDVVVQHLPTNKRGEHADFDGPGNRYSIGIEMCEHRGNSRARTIERTAMLTAALMRTHNIPLSNVVPHYHWPRYKYDNPHKDCPHFLLDNGRPGPTWNWFLSRVKHHYDRTEPGRKLASSARASEQKSHGPALVSLSR